MAAAWDRLMEAAEEDEGRPDDRIISDRVLQTMKHLTVGNNTVVLADIEKYVLRKAAVEIDAERDLTMLHPSEMCKPDWCWRRDFYRITGVPVDPKTLNPSFRLENVWTEGHDIHHKWQGWLWDMRVLYGVFQCARCDERWWDCSPQECFYCDAPRDHLIYREIPLTAPHLNIIGHSDGGLMLDQFRLLEIKSIGVNSLRFDAPHLWDMYQRNETLDKIWMEINRPFPSHVRQAALYLYMATRGVENVPIPRSIIFLYEAKWNQQVKEFEVTYSPRMVERMLYGAQLVTDSLSHGMPPIRPQWATDSQVHTCRSCVYRKTCWRIRDHDNQGVASSLTVKRAPAVLRRRFTARKAS